MKKLLTILFAAVLSITLTVPAYAAPLTTTSLLETQEFVNIYTDAEWDAYDKFCDKWVERTDKNCPTITQWKTGKYKLPAAKKTTKKTTKSKVIKVKKNMTLANFKKTKTWKDGKPWKYETIKKCRYYYSLDEYVDETDFLHYKDWWNYSYSYNDYYKNNGVSVGAKKFKKVKNTWRYVGTTTIRVK